MQMHNPYTPPESNLMRTVELDGRKRTIEEALEEGYDFSINDVVSRGWKAVKGMKLNFFLGALVILAVNFLIGVVSAFTNEGLSLGLEFISNILTTCLSAGFCVMSLKHLRGQSVSFKEDFFAIGAFFTVLLLASVGVMLMTTLGLILLIIPGIYLAISYSLVLWIIVDHPGIKVWAAMEASRKLVSKHWFKFFGLLFVLGFFFIISLIPLGIGTLWTVPLLSLSLGVLYQIIFNEETALAEVSL